MIRLGTGLMSAAYWRPKAGYLPATTALVARMASAPPAGRAAAIDGLIRALVAAGVWSRLDLLQVLAAHDTQAARLNWIAPSYDLGAYNSPLFTANRGFKGDGAAAYLEAAGYNPSAGGTRYGLNDASYGLWVLTPNTVSGGIDIYLGESRMARRTPTHTDYHLRINDAATAYGPGGDVGAFFAADRPNSATKRQFRNGALNATYATPSTVSASYLRLLSTGSGAYSNAEVAAAFAGGALTDTQHAALHAALRTYLVTVGAMTP